METNTDCNVDKYIDGEHGRNYWLVGWLCTDHCSIRWNPLHHVSLRMDAMCPKRLRLLRGNASDRRSGARRGTSARAKQSPKLLAEILILVLLCPQLHYGLFAALVFA